MSIVQQLNGTIEREWHEDGLVVRLVASTGAAAPPLGGQPNSLRLTGGLTERSPLRTPSA